MYIWIIKFVMNGISIIILVIVEIYYECYLFNNLNIFVFKEI